MHIYDSRFPLAPNAKLRPPDTTVDDCRLFQKRIGGTRNVVVTPSTYGTDNSCTLDAIARLGPTARDVAVAIALAVDRPRGKTHTTAGLFNAPTSSRSQSKSG
jgi:D-galactarolactone isomerase